MNNGSIKTLNSRPLRKLFLNPIVIRGHLGILFHQISQKRHLDRTGDLRTNLSSRRGWGGYIVYNQPFFSFYGLTFQAGGAGGVYSVLSTFLQLLTLCHFPQSLSTIITSPTPFINWSFGFKIETKRMI